MNGGRPMLTDSMLKRINDASGHDLVAVGAAPLECSGMVQAYKCTRCDVQFVEGREVDSWTLPGPGMPLYVEGGKDPIPGVTQRPSPPFPPPCRSTP